MHKISNFTKDGYLEAAQERWRDANALLQNEIPRYEGACYLGGYTIEMILKYIAFINRGCDVIEEYKQLTLKDIADLEQGTMIRYNKNDYNLANIHILIDKLNTHLKKKIYQHDLYSIIKYLDDTFDTRIDAESFKQEYDRLYLWSERWRYRINIRENELGVIERNFAKNFFQQANDFLDFLHRMGLLNLASRNLFINISVQESV